MQKLRKKKMRLNSVTAIMVKWFPVSLQNLSLARMGGTQRKALRAGVGIWFRTKKI